MSQLKYDNLPYNKNMEDIKVVFKNRLKELRDEKGLSQQALAKKLNYTQTCIAKWESGTRSPSIENLAVLARFFEVSADYLLGLEDYDSF